LIEIEAAQAWGANPTTALSASIRIANRNHDIEGLL
jgi:hypothetical protein